MTVTGKILVLPLLLLLSFSPCAAEARAEAPPERGYSDAWLDLGFGFGDSQKDADSALALRTGLTVSNTIGDLPLALVGRYSTNWSFLAGNAHDWAFLAGPVLEFDHLYVLPALGLGRAWGEYDSSIFGGTNWGPEGSIAYEVQIMLKHAPWLGATIYGCQNDTSDLAGATVTFRFGWLPEQ